MYISNIALLGVATVSIVLALVIGIIALVAGGAVGFILKNILQANKIKTAKLTAAKILEDAYAQAKNAKKEQIQHTTDEINLLKKCV